MLDLGGRRFTEHKLDRRSFIVRTGLAAAAASFGVEPAVDARRKGPDVPAVELAPVDLERRMAEEFRRAMKEHKVPGAS